RWIIQPQGGYAVGPSHANPYTGEIYDADIRISVDFIRYFFQEFQDMISPQSQLNYIPDDTRFDNHLTDAFGQQISFAASFLRGKNLLSSEESREEFVEQGIISLVVHEVGHTLGLRHNFKASTCYSLKQLQDADFTLENGICSSVMDYPAVNLSLSGDDQGDYFQIKPGPWDYWMIEYGYAHFKEEKEDKMLEKIARKCTDPLLDYATDEDTFGFSTRGMDPHSNIFDLGSDPIEFHEYRLQLAQEIWKNITDNFEKPGKSYKVLLPVFNQALGEYRLAANNISKYIGGLYTHRDHIGDPSARPPFEPVLRAEQEKALDFLINNILSERSFQFSPELLNKLVYEKMDTFSYNIWSRERIDYPVHQQIKYIQEIVFSHLYDPLVLQRLQDNELRMSDQNESFGLGDLFPRIRQAVWDDHQDVNQNSSLRRQLHDLHLTYLTDIALQKNKAIPREATALARYDLLEIRKICEKSLEESDSPVQKAHLLDIINRIETCLNPIIQL
ncbi:MAG: zinc-dependent metalloprotease, partial [Candidatus Cloacimonetes bacterium]|nr:zinc-dependent metalloprotease [Candidatus Cloacimonadota bacterium]